MNRKEIKEKILSEYDVNKVDAMILEYKMYDDKEVIEHLGKISDEENYYIRKKNK